MARVKTWFLVGMALFGLSACASYDPATRNAPLEVPMAQSIQPSFDVAELKIAVPRNLTVSEANVYYPRADIVWRDDPMGNRHKQVLNIFAESMQRGTDQLEGLQDVVVEVEVLRFHAMTEKARYTIGGVHSIKFNLTVRDAQTGAVIVPTRLVNADLPGLGGQAAIAADAAGNTQKVRIMGPCRNGSNFFQTFQRPRAACAINDDRLDPQRRLQRLDKFTLTRIGPCRIGLKNRAITKAVDDDARQSIGFSMHKTIEWRVIKIVAERGCPHQPGLDPIRINGGLGISVQHADGDFGCRRQSRPCQKLARGIL